MTHFDTLDKMIQNEKQANHYYRNSSLSHDRWRFISILVEQKLKTFHPNYTICSPFGFELLWGADNAPMQIRKFYVYANNPESISTENLANLIEKIVFENINQYYPEILNDFKIIIKNQDVTMLYSEPYSFTSTDKLLDIQVRDTRDSILNDYANYIILSYQSILIKKAESLNYDVVARHRNRMLQLAIMLLKLYEPFLQDDIVLKCSPLIKKAKPLVNNSLNLFIDSLKNKISLMTQEEESLITQYVLPLCENIHDLILKSSQTGDCVKLDIIPYHVQSDQNLKAVINQDLYDQLLKRVINTYNNFANVTEN